MTEAQRNEQILKQKARDSYVVAVRLQREFPNIAANRAYYALYQAIVGEFEHKGIKPEIIDPHSAHADNKNEQGKWRHATVRYNSTLVGLNNAERDLLHYAEALRVMADYSSDTVDSHELEHVIRHIPDILEGLGVAIK